MAISAEEQNFNDRVEKSPIVQSLRDGQMQIQETLENEIQSNDKRFGKLEDKVDSLEVKVDNGFKQLGGELQSLTKAILDNENERLINSNAELKDELTRKRNNSDKIKNTSITGLILTVGGFFLEKIGFINLVG